MLTPALGLQEENVGAARPCNDGKCHFYSREKPPVMAMSTLLVPSETVLVLPFSDEYEELYPTLNHGI